MNSGKDDFLNRPSKDHFWCAQCAKWRLSERSPTLFRGGEMTEWQPIETAPRDGTMILGGWWGADEKWLSGVFYWRQSLHNVALEGWHFCCHDIPNRPTHWKPIGDPPPLPAPPAKEEEG